MIIGKFRQPSDQKDFDGGIDPRAALYLGICMQETPSQTCHKVQDHPGPQNRTDATKRQAVEAKMLSKARPLRSCMMLHSPVLGDSAKLKFILIQG
jgi:hypothetical protein